MDLRRKWKLLILVALVLTGLAIRQPVKADEEGKKMLLKTFMDEFVSITPGEGKFPASFEMGDSQAGPSERPSHPVKMSARFAMAKYEVPQNLYEAVMGTNPSKWKGPRNSVEMMSWEDANNFCKKITLILQTEGLLSKDEIIRLPTEAEWEYCCRAGTTTKYSFGAKAQRDGDVSPKATILNEFGWHTGNAAGNDPKVGELKPNPWGLYDMHGYLWEFTADAWSADYTSAPADGSAVQPTAKTRLIVTRGGSWKNDFEKLTSSARSEMTRTDKDDAVGFRCVKAAKTK